MTEVELPDGVVAEFPDEMSDDDIKSVLRKEFPSESQPSTPVVEPPSTLRTPVKHTPFTEQEFAMGDPEYGGVLSRMSSKSQPWEVMQRGVPSALGVTPDMIPSGSTISQSPLARAGVRAVGGPIVEAALQPAATIASSVGKTALGIGDYLSSRQGITELIGSLTPARLLVMGKWAADMAAGAGQEAGDLVTLLQKPNKTPEDWQQISDRTVNTTAMTLGAGGLAKSGGRAIARTLEPKKMKAVRELDELLRTTEPDVMAAPVTEQRQLGIPQASLTAEPFLQPGVPELADAALRESQTRVVAPGQEGVAANALRQAIEPTQLTQVEPTRLAERVEGGGEAPYGKVSYQRAAEAPIAERTQRALRESPITAIDEAAINRGLEAQRAEPPPLPTEPAPPNPVEPLSTKPIEETPKSTPRNLKDVKARYALEGTGDGGSRWVEVKDAKPVVLKSASWLKDLFVRREINPNGSKGEYYVVEPRSGSGIGYGKTAADAIAMAERHVAKVGREQIEKNISYTESVNPPTPRVREMRPIEPGRGEEINAPSVEDVRAQRALEARQRVGDEDLSVSVQSPQKFGEQTAPGYVQVDSIRGGKNEWSSNPTKLIEEGYDIPTTEQLQSLPQGKYSMAEAKQLLKDKGAPDLVSRLEALKFPETGNGRLYSLPHPDAIKSIGKTTWNSAVDAAIAAVKAGKSIAEAIEAGIDYLRKNVKAFDEKQARANIEYVTKGETEVSKPASKPPAISAATIEVKDPITGEPAKLITEKAARAMESKVKIPAETDVKKLADQMNLFSKEIGDALETGGQFLAKDLRPDVAKGAPAERGTVTSKDINQYFVNKLSSIRKDMQATKQKIAQQADVESGVYFDLLQKRFEQAFQQVQELRRASHESLYFWNKIKAEYQDIARAAGEMPEMKRQLPVLDQIWKDMREKKYPQAGKHFVDYLRMNLFTMGSWTLDFGTNLVATGTKLPAWAIMDMGAMVTGRAPTRMFSAMRALSNNMKNWLPGKRFRLPEQIESELGMTAGGEFGGRGREVMVDFSEILKDHPELADKLRHVDKVIGAPVRMKRAVDGFFGRFGATAELYNRAYMEGKTRGMKGDELKTFVEEFVQNPPEAAIGRAVKTGKELKFNRDLTKWEEAYAGNILTKLVVEAFPRWTLQFIRWGGEMTGANPVFFRDLVTGKATPEQAVHYLTKAATGWGGIYAFNQLFYDNIDANSMEYVKEDGNRVRLAGRTPAPELFFIVAMLRGDTEKAKAALAHLSVPGAKLLSGEPAGLISPLVDTIRESIRGRYTMEQTARELTKLVNDTIPGKSVLGLIRAIYDPTIREGIGSPIPGLASRLPQRPNPTTGEPLAPKTRIPGTKIELPTVGGTPFPGAERVLNDIEKALLNHGLGNTRPRRTSIIDLPAEDVPKDVRREYEKLVGQNVKEFIGAEIQEQDFKELPFEVRREVLQQLLTNARAIARADIAEKYGASGESVQSTPLNIQRMPKRLRQ